MSKNIFINTDFWTDTWVVDHLNPLDRYLFLYLFTNPHTNVAGVYELSLRIMGFETGMDREELVRMLKRLEPHVIYQDGWVILRNGIKHQNYKNEKMKTAIETRLSAVPSEILQHIKFPKDWGGTRPKGSKQTKLIDDLSIPYTSPMGNNNYNHNNNNNLNPNFNNNEPAKKTAQTKTGFKKLMTKKECDLLYEDYSQLINEDFKGWYYKCFFKLGREKVQRLAGEAKADGKDPKRLFSHLLAKEAGEKEMVKS